MKLKSVSNKDGPVGWAFWCPACDQHHVLFTAPTFNVHTNASTPVWLFDGNQEHPTFSPSLIVTGKYGKCHLFLRQGKIEYLGDCEHAMAGQIIDLPDLPRFDHQN